MKTLLLAGLCAAVYASSAAAAERVEFASPGFPATAMDAQGRLVEPWGTLAIKTDRPLGSPTVELVKLDGVVPAARAVWNGAAVKLTATAFRAPVFPNGADVLTVRAQSQGEKTSALITLELPEGAEAAARAVNVAGRPVIRLPAEAVRQQELRDWGYIEGGRAMPGWGKPSHECDPAYRNIRAGMGGQRIAYSFSVPAKAKANVALGFCESHWDVPGSRPMVCTVEGAAQDTVDPVAAWGQHGAGAVAFAASDVNGDGRIEVAVSSAEGARDRNAILNAIWVFPAGPAPELAKVVAGSLSDQATHYVDVGGPNDQSVWLPGKVEYRLRLNAREAKELVFLLASPGGSEMPSEATAWTLTAMRQAAVDVWSDWKDRALP